jgi:hypothetical protein
VFVALRPKDAGARVSRCASFVAPEVKRIGFHIGTASCGRWDSLTPLVCLSSLRSRAAARLLLLLLLLRLLRLLELWGRSRCG